MSKPRSSLSFGALSILRKGVKPRYEDEERISDEATNPRLYLADNTLSVAYGVELF